MIFWIILFITTHALASRLFVASYSGTVSTLSLHGDHTSSYSLSLIASSTACATNSSWLTLDRQRDILYCSDRGLTSLNGSLNSLKIQPDGSLIAIDRVFTLVGAVSTVLYADSSKLAVAYYSSSAAGTFDVSSPANIKPVQTFQYSLASPGLDPVYETAPHPHEALLDPTGNFILIPDLGADLIHLYRINSKKTLEALKPLQVPVGSGPRHAAFLVARSGTYFYVVSQLTNVLTAYGVTYNTNETLSFRPIFAQSLLKTGREVDFQAYSAAAEIHVTPDQNFLLVSQRNDSFFSIQNPTNHSETIASDSLLSFSLNHRNGNFSLIGISPAGGSFPRQFSINEKGDLVAVGLQNDGRVVVIERDVESGRMGEIVTAWSGASGEGDGQVVCVVWDE